MKTDRLITLFLVVATMALAPAAMANPETLNFANVVGGSITFVGNGSGASFSFPPDTPSPDFIITGMSNFVKPGSLLDFTGNIIGNFAYTNVVDVIPGVLETATITSGNPGEFVIHDGAGSDFTAQLVWTDISTVVSSGGVNTSGDVNLSGFSYSGANEQLMELAATVTGSVTATFSFVNPNRDLHALASTECSGPSNPCSTEFVGTLTASATPTITSAVPEPQGAVFVLGVLGLLGIVRRYRAA